MIDNETPVLRKEELLSILEALFKFSDEANNAISRKADGLYVKDFYNAFKAHIDNQNIHATNQELIVLREFTIVNDILHYKGTPVAVTRSNVQGNGIEIKPDGLYVKDITPHIENTNIHVTAQDKENWNGTLQSAKDYTNDLINALVTYDYLIVNQLPIDEAAINEHIIYCLNERVSENGETHLIRHLYRNHQWIRFDLTKQTYDTFARKSEIEETYVKKNDDSVHSHANKEVLDLFTKNENEQLLYNGNNIFSEFRISDDEDNALFLGSDNKLYVKDLSEELASIARQASLSKTVILSQECDEAGIYELEEAIENFNFIMIYYYLKPDDPNLAPYDAKMEMLDTAMLTELYVKHIDYILEHDYGLSTNNTKIRFFDRNKMQVTYYNKVCIYKIIGVR